MQTLAYLIAGLIVLYLLFTLLCTYFVQQRPRDPVSDFPDWAPSTGNVGYYGSDFSEFENFQRGYFIIDTGKYGHVAMVAVGLNTISSIVFNPKFENVTKPVPVKRGEELGNFIYGGSLFVMIFEPGRYKSGAIKVRLGNQIGVFDTGNDKTTESE